MADTAALAEARAVLDEATDLSRRIRAEIVALEKALAAGRQSLDQIERMGRDGSTEISRLAEDLRRGRDHEARARGQLAALGRIEAGLPPFEARIAYLQALGHETRPSAHPPQAVPIVYRAPTKADLDREADELEKTVSPIWDRLARAEKTLGRRFSEAMEMLDKAEKLVEETQPTPRAREAEGSPKRPRVRKTRR